MPYAGPYVAGQVVAGGLLPADSGITGLETLYMASAGYVSRPTDAAPNRVYAPRLTAGLPLVVSRSVLGADTPVSRFGPGSAELELAVGDATLDTTLTRGGFAGHPLTCRAVARTAGVPRALDTAETLFAGLTERLELGLDRARLRAATRGLELQQPLESGSFAGSGGIEGGDDLAGKSYPSALGYAAGVQPPYLGVISSLHSYRVAGGDSLPIQDVPAFYDKGVALTKVSGTPAAGQYSVNTATGLVQIGGANAADFPTCDVEGYAPGGIFKQTTADIIEAVLTDFGQATGILRDGFAFSRLNGDQPATVGRWYGPGESPTRAQVIAEFLRGAVAWGGVRRDEVFDLGQLQGPSGAIRLVLDSSNVMELSPLNPPAVMAPAAWKIEVGYNLNHTVTRDIAESAGAAQRQFMAARWRLAAASKPAIQARDPASRIFFVPGLFKLKADAEALAARLLALFENARVWRLRAGLTPANLEIGQTLELRLRRLGVEAVLGTLLGYRADYRAGTTELHVFVSGL